MNESSPEKPDQPVIIVFNLDPANPDVQRVLAALRQAAAPPPPPPPPDERYRQWYTVTVAAKYCGCSTSKIYDDLNKGILTRDNIEAKGCPPKFRRETLDRYQAGFTQPRKKTHGNTKSIT